MSNAPATVIGAPEIQEALQQKDQQIAALQGELFVLKEQLDWLKKQIFGSKSERIVADLGIQPLLPEFDLGTTFVPAPQEEIAYKRNKPVKNRGCDTISFPDDLPVKRVLMDLPAEEKVCPQTGMPLVEIGSETSRKLARKPEQFYIIEYVRPKYASKAAPELGVKYRGLPDAVISRCPADESLLAFVLTSKFVDISRSTVWWKSWTGPRSKSAVRLFPTGSLPSARRLVQARQHQGEPAPDGEAHPAQIQISPHQAGRGRTTGP